MDCGHDTLIAINMIEGCEFCRKYVEKRLARGENRKIAALERQIEKTEQVVRIYDEIIMNTKQKLAEAVRVLEEIVLFADKFGSSGRCYHLKKIAQDFLKGE